MDSKSAVEEVKEAWYGYMQGTCYELALRHAEELDRLRSENETLLEDREELKREIQRVRERFEAENEQLRKSLDKINDDCLRAEQENERLRQELAECKHACQMWRSDSEQNVERARAAEAALATGR